MDGTQPPSITTTRSPHTPAPIREDCWSEEATSTLVDAWGERHLELNRGNLRQKHWQEVADAVNARHGSLKKFHRTDVQCKNRIDTLKKKYKLEKAKILASGGVLASNWPFYSRLDVLIGPNMPPKKLGLLPSQPRRSSLERSRSRSRSPPLALPMPYRKCSSNSNSNSMLPHASPVPVAPRSSREKRLRSPRSVPVPVAVDDSFFRKNYSALAAAAAAAASTDSDTSRSSTESKRGEGEVDGVKELAQAITRFGEIYEKVEGVKQRQMVELEKQRMEFMKSLEFQRMQLFMDWQVQLEKIKRSKRSANSEK